jgi:hypothetical protein
MVGDGNAMGVCAQIAQHMFRSMKGRLAIDDPVLTEQYSKPGGRGSWVGQCSELAVELDAAFAEGIFGQLSRKLCLTTCRSRPGIQQPRAGWVGNLKKVLN